jgi:hypothetical protein
MPNRLAAASSPYLLQHADNPVDWFPWGDEALDKAKVEDKPIFLSIGYAACHWCHVMERESFEDPDTAAYMNEHFVSIKVDREERPDIDGIYMDAVQAMTGSGGWPLSAFLTPDGTPFWAGTYLPPEPQHGMLSFRDVLEGIARAWRDRREEILAGRSQMVEVLGRTGQLTASRDPLSDEVRRSAFSAIRGSFDERWGGFGRAPKFPQPMVLGFLLRMATRGTRDALGMVTRTLDAMSAGGIHDHVGGGFARYSTDEKWHVPHFEKMLYDNAQLAQIYTHSWLQTRNEDHRLVAERTLEYLLREMQHPEGGFFSSQDADSEGVEGRFFTWTWDELRELVGEPVAVAFGASPGGNWEGTNVLWHPSKADRIEEARTVLFEARQLRVPPATDDKILATWNGLAIRAFAEAGRAFANPALVEAAVRAGEFATAHLMREGKLRRSWRDGVVGGPGFADDHALLGLAFLTLYETTFDLRWFTAARRLADELVESFLDEERGGFYQTSKHHERLVVRPKELYDNPTPSGNSAGAELLLRLSLLEGDVEMERAGVSALRLVRDLMAQAPAAFGHALCALDLYLGPSREIAISGEPSDPRTQALVDEVHSKRFLPNVVIAVAPEDDQEAAGKVALLRGRKGEDGKPTAYVCERFACLLPVTEPSDLAEQLVGVSAPR